MEITLFIKDRLVIPTLLPTQGGTVEILTSRSIKQATQLTIDDLAGAGLYDIKDANGEQTGKMAWDPGKDTGVTYNFTYEQLAMLKESAEKVMADKKVTEDNVDTLLKLSNLKIENK